MSSALADVAARIGRVEGRLERLLASGWRSAAMEAGDLAEDVAALEALGLRAAAGAVARVQEATSGTAALEAVSQALAACRQVRVRLVGVSGAGAVQAAPEGAWAPLAPGRRSARTLDRLIPVACLALEEGEEVWACVRLQGQWASQVVLVDPPGGLEEPVWLGSVLEGLLSWQARYPLGADGSVERCALADATRDGAMRDGGVRDGRARDDLRDALRKPFKEGHTLLSGSGALTLRRLHRAEAHACVWPDAASAQVFASYPEEQVWALTFGSAAIAPLALLTPKGFLRPPALLHLVPGLPRTPLG